MKNALFFLLVFFALSLALLPDVLPDGRCDGDNNIDEIDAKSDTPTVNTFLCATGSDDCTRNCDDRCVDNG
ncbi:MAG TPA: hypothetical protein VJB06_04165, partial [archaeon]|nr:hypothetical protein [archaeon]